MESATTILIGIGLSVCGWFARSLASSEKEKIIALAKKQDDQAEKIQQIELLLVGKYHNKDELEKILDEKLQPIQLQLSKIIRWIESQSTGFAPLG